MLEKAKTAAQKLERLRALLARVPHADRQGSVQKQYRNYRGRRLGAYWRVIYRADGRVRSVYLGKDAELLALARQALIARRAPLRLRRQRRRQDAAARSVLKDLKANFEKELARYDLLMKGYEVRGSVTMLGSTTRN